MTTPAAADLVSALAVSVLSSETAKLGDLADFYARVSALMAYIPYTTLQLAFADFKSNVAKLRKLGPEKLASEVLLAEWSSTGDTKALCATDGNAHTTLLWLNRGLELVAVLLAKLEAAPNRDVSIREVYEASLSKHHGFVQRALVSAAAGSTISASQLSAYLGSPKHLPACKDRFTDLILQYSMLERRARGELA